MKRFLVLVAVAGALSGCGPIKSTSHLLDAEVQIQAARTAGAEKLAPYEWTAANLYIHKAREEQVARRLIALQSKRVRITESRM